jgi:diguanylate cyclase (GGDEF)-like protein
VNPPTQAKILVVDDNPTNRKVLVAVLQHAGYETLEASDGAEGLATVMAEQPQLVMSDILMPTMDGYEFVRRLRADHVVKETPVIFHTAHYHEREARNLARICNVERVIAKPASNADILAAVRQVLTAQLRPASQHPIDASFDREHLRLMTNKLSDSTNDLLASNARLNALIELNVQMASERDSQLLLEKVCNVGRELLGARFAVLAIFDSTHTGAALFATSGLERQGATWGAPTNSSGRLAAAFAESRSARVYQANSAVADIGLPPGYPPAQAFLVAPVCSLSRTYGWICLADKVGALGFSADDEHLLTTLAAQLGRIYENGSLYARIQYLNRIYAVLSGINSLIVRVQDRGELLREACRLAVEHGHFRFAWCAAKDLGTRGAALTSWAGDSAELARMLSADTDSASLLATAMRSQQPGICDPATETNLLAGYRAEIESRGYRSIIALPLVVADESVGCLVLAVTEPGFFNVEETRLLGELAGDISFALDHIAKAERLNYLAYYDELTGIANRSFFLSCLSIHMNNAARGDGKLAVVVLQIERFESICDTVGRAATDDLVREIARRFTAALGDPEFVGRIGSDRFAAVVASVEDEADVIHALDRWWPQLLGTPFRVGNDELILAAKAGIALFPADGDDGEMLLQRADAALRKSRNIGDRHVFYTQHLSERGSEKLALESKLRRALEHEEFVLHYQPKVDLETRHLTGLEALLRWRRPDGTLMPPASFIPLLEETGLIAEVGIWVLEQACRDRSRWLELDDAAPRIAINVSTVQLQHKDFVARVQASLRPHEHGVGIDMEVTESLIMQDAEDNIAKLSALRGLGVRIAIDDFGTGYSSLGYLTKLPASVLKIDRSFVNSMLDDPRSMTLVSTIISLAHALRLEVVAEGVESDEQAKILRLLRCDQMQGYLISRPVDFDGMTTYLRTSFR